MTAFVPLDVPRARRILGQAGVDGLIAASLENVYYFTGLWSENFEILPKQTQLFAILTADELTDPRIVAVLGEAANIHDHLGTAVRPFLYGTFYRYVSESNELNDIERFVKENVLDRAAHPTAIDATAAALRDAGLDHGRIAYDERSIFPETLEALRDRLPDASFVPGWVLFRQIRAVKTPSEQERLARAVSVAETAMQAAMRVAVVGVTEADMIAAYEKSVIDSGARPNFAQIVFGRRGGTGYVMRRDAALEPGDIIRFDVGAACDGYHSDIARNFALEEPDPRTRRIHAAMVAGQQAAAEALRPGVTASEVFETGMRAAREAGVPDYQRHHIGHGLGLEVYDIPVLTPSDSTELEEGMVISVETPYYELGFGGLQPEDAFVVTPDGGRWLNSLSRAFEVWDGTASVPSR